jgi:hypothetical protein
MTQTEIFRPKDKDENVAEDVAAGIAVGIAVGIAACSEDEETCSVGEVATLGVVGGLLGYFGSKTLKKTIRPPFF